MSVHIDALFYLQPINFRVGSGLVLFSSCLCDYCGQCLVAWILRELGCQHHMKIWHPMVDTTTTMVYMYCGFTILWNFCLAMCIWSVTYRLYIIVIIMLIWVACIDTWKWIWLQPTLHFFHNGEKASEVVGADLQRIKDTMENLYKWNEYAFCSCVSLYTCMSRKYCV